VLKKIALIAILVGSSVAPLARSQEDPGSEDDADQASDESASEGDESAADESPDADAAADESAGVADAKDSSDEAHAPADEDESAGDVADGQEEEEEAEDASADDREAGDQAVESDGMETGADVDAPNPVSEVQPAQPTPVAPTPPTPPVVSNPPVAPTPPKPPVVSNPPPAPAPGTPAVQYCGQYRMPAETAVNGNRQSGIVKQLDEAKGNGLIMPDEGGQDLFVHSQSMQGNSSWGLAQGQAVTFKTVVDAMASRRQTKSRGCYEGGGNGVGPSVRTRSGRATLGDRNGGQSAVSTL